MIPSPVNLSTVPPYCPHYRRSTVDQVGHDLPQPLGPHRRADVHRMNNIGEQHRDLLVLGTGIVRRYRRTTAVTESRTLTRLGATRAAHCYGRHPTLRQSGPRVKRALKIAG